ncbi:hypothetical protein Vretimale_17957 [Volvox reticuliferus]|uniref:Uncharacterized protein n=1 Tax=Volvox reticuliferus TaxID=1737510 RepID=A0A8J4LYX5_9CHLO|nr:hypothetical protein Vretifemale_17639 [Volvox reticuliferus]GIM15150.1 hypothetical protein Vretimale_17957 [Volvox reticuliferus]
MSSSRMSVGRVSKGSVPPSVPKAGVEFEGDDEFVNDGGQAAEDIGKSFVFRNTLTESEVEALERWKRSQNDDDEEQYPLSSKQRNVTYGDIKKPQQSVQLGPDSEALCIAASCSGNMLAVGGRHGTVRLFHPHNLEPMDTIRISELASSSTSTSSPSSVSTLASRQSIVRRQTVPGGLMGSAGRRDRAPPCGYTSCCPREQRGGQPDKHPGDAAGWGDIRLRRLGLCRARI